MYLRNGNCSDKTDVFAFGVVMAEILTGKLAIFQHHREGRAIHLSQRMLEVMPDATKDVIKKEELDEKIRENWPEDSFREFSQIMRQCLEMKEERRPTMLDICQRLRLASAGKHRVCAICMGNPPNAKLQCGHAILCPSCSQDIRRRGDGCPICRAPIIAMEFGFFSKTFVS